MYDQNKTSLVYLSIADILLKQKIKKQLPRSLVPLIPVAAFHTYLCSSFPERFSFPMGSLGRQQNLTVLKNRFPLTLTTGGEKAILMKAEAFFLSSIPTGDER